MFIWGWVCLLITATRWNVFRKAQAPESYHMSSFFRKHPITLRLLYSENTRSHKAPSVFRKWPSAERPLSGRSGCWGFNINSNGGGSGSVNSGSSSYRRLDEARTLQVSGNPPRNAVIAILNGHKYKTQTLVCTSMARHRIAPLSLC